MEQTYKSIPKEKFEFAQMGADLHDEKFKTKSRSYMQDAFIRFKKNKSSVVAACIIAFLILFSIVSPIISPYSVHDTNNVYVKMPPFVEPIANMGIGILDGSLILESQGENQLIALKAIGQETGHDPIIEITGTKIVMERDRGKDVPKTYYSVNVNAYYQIGIRYQNFSFEEYEALQKWQDENKVQVIYPWVEPIDVYFPNLDKSDAAAVKAAKKKLSDANINLNANVWYVCDPKTLGKANQPILDANEELTAAYSTDQSIAGRDQNGDPIYYTSTMRVAGDDGSYIYSREKSGSVQCRIDYYNYYRYLNDGKTPTFIFGTDSTGADLFCAIGMGARFSLIFAVIVAAINLTLGAIYGAIQGYYGGIIDLVMDRISDILSGVPFMVVTTLFQLHLAKKVGPVGSFLFAFVLTGWIGMAALTRKQFYRFKSQEYILAARTLGASDRRLMFKHIFPNAIGTMITSCALVIPGVISSETSLTYLGIIDLSSITGTSIGTLMSTGQNAIQSAPHAMLYPALFLSLLLISFNLFGNGLRDAFNPSTRGAEE